eukprot:scaffold7349_cov173-Amphora_coffeaeformis.AAC.19
MANVVSSWQVLASVYVSVRIFWACRIPIMDCDEVYNYWEPLFFVLYGDGGLQTWEYAHEYALRTYAYLWPLTQLAPLLSPLMHLLQPASALLTDFPVKTERLAAFVAMKALLAGSMAVAELVWCHALATRLLTSRRHVPFYLTLIMGTSAGMNHAAAALLPSSSWMFAFLMASTAYLYEQHILFCLTAVTATLTIGWPFGVVMLAPLGLRVLWKEWTLRSFQGVFLLLTFTASIAAAIQAVVMVVDYQNYGIWVSPTINIFTYNAAGGGDELYGTEPTTYYVKNLFLNLNVVAFLGVAVLPMIVFTQLRDADLVVLLSPLYVWLAIVVPRPHKEERFLFPIYPLLCLGAVLTVDKIANFIGRIVSALSRHKELMRRQRHAVHILVWSLAAVVSMSRTMALYKYYSAPMHIYAALNTLQKGKTKKVESKTVCTCGEWYRFPSSFFLPQGTHLVFLESSFKGQLPQYFSVHGSRPESQQVLQPFNDQNKEEPSRYGTLETCDWIVDLQDGECAPAEAQVVKSVPFMDAARTQALHRILYLPYLHERGVETGKVQYQNYTLYKMMPQSADNNVGQG